MEEVAKDITIVVNSCDKYKDAWNPFFRLFSIQWPDCPYDIVLNTEQLSYKCDHLNVKTINSEKNIPWAKRLRKVLEQIDTEFILFFLEDFFLQKEVNTEAFEEAHRLIKNDTQVGFIGLRYNEHQVFKAPPPAKFGNRAFYFKGRHCGSSPHQYSNGVMA